MPAMFSDDEGEDGHRQSSDGRTYRAIQLEKPSENANVKLVNKSATFGGQVDSCDVRVVQRILKKYLQPVCIELRLSPNAHTLDHKTLVSLLADYNMVRLYRAGQMTPAHKQVAEKNIAQYNNENNIKETYNRFQDGPEEADAVTQREPAGGGGAGGAVPVGSVLEAVGAVENDTTPSKQIDSDSESSIEYLMPWMSQAVSQAVLALAMSSVGSTNNPTAHTPVRTITAYVAAVGINEVLHKYLQPTGLHANCCKYAQSEITYETISRPLYVVVAHFGAKCGIDFFAMLGKFIMLEKRFKIQNDGFLHNLRYATEWFQTTGNDHQAPLMCGVAGNTLASSDDYGLWSLATACTTPMRQQETIVFGLIAAIWVAMTAYCWYFPLKNTNLRYLEMCKDKNDQSNSNIENNCYVSFIVSSPTAAFEPNRDDTNVTGLKFNTKTYTYFSRDGLLSDWLCDNLDAFPGPELEKDTTDKKVEAFVLNDFFKTEDAYCQSIMKILFANVVSKEDGIKCPAELLYERMGTERDLFTRLATAGVTALITGGNVVASVASVGRALVVGSPELTRRKMPAQPPAAKPALDTDEKARTIVKGALNHWCDWVSTRDNIKDKIRARLTARSVAANVKGWNDFYKIINEDEKQNLLRDERAELTEAQRLDNELRDRRRAAEVDYAKMAKIKAETELIHARTAKEAREAAKGDGDGDK